MEGKISWRALFGAWFVSIALACAALVGPAAQMPVAYADDSAQLTTQAAAGVNKPDADKQATLLDNLTERFAATGGDEAITNDTYYAAIAQNVLGLHGNIDADACVKAAVEYAQGDDVYAGTLAKYITVLHAAGVDCTSVSYGGTTYDLVALMNSKMNNDSLGVTHAVCILPVYTFGYDMSAAKYTDAEFIQAILDSQQNDDLFGPVYDGVAYPDTTTTSQALMALALFQSKNSDIAPAVQKAITAIEGLQQADGRFKNESYETQWPGVAVDATALAVAALSAWGIDVTDDSFVTANGSTPLGYLVSCANSSFDGVEKALTYGEEMSASSVFLALATVQANADQGALINPLEMKFSMFRLYNPNSGEHFYTKSIEERDNLVSVGWSFEGTGWISPASSSEPVYRLYNPNAGDHHYTTSITERDTLKAVGWSYEGIGWYSDPAKTITVYRQYNPNAIAGAHNFTTSTAERDNLVSLGWSDEKEAWYGVK